MRRWTEEIPLELDEDYDELPLSTYLWIAIIVVATLGFVNVLWLLG